MYKTLLFLSFIFLYASVTYAQFNAIISIAADNTYALSINGDSLSTLCPDANTSVSGPSDNPTCYWSQATTYAFDATNALIAVRFRNANGPSGNALTGYTNPGAFLSELNIENNECARILPWTCIDDIRAQQLYDNNQPPVTWTTDPNFPTTFWTTGGITDYGANSAQAWASGFGATAAALYGGNSYWWNAAGGRPVSGISEQARWQWYNADAPNRDLFCRLLISVNASCPGGNIPSPTPSVSITPTSSVSITPTSSVSVTPTPSVSITPTPSVSESPSASSSTNPSNSPSSSSSASASQSPNPSASSTPSVSVTPTPSASQSPPPNPSESSSPSSSSSSSSSPIPPASASPIPPASATPSPSASPYVPPSSSPSGSQSPIVACIPSPSSSPVVVCNPSPSRSPRPRTGKCCDQILDSYEYIIEDAESIDRRISSALSLLREIESVNSKLDALSDVVREARRLQRLLDGNNNN